LPSLHWSRPFLQSTLQSRCLPSALLCLRLPSALLCLRLLSPAFLYSPGLAMP
ncbi:hypothetical protein M9458_010219, partial [Cirrhinus mrigala]